MNSGPVLVSQLGRFHGQKPLKVPGVNRRPSKYDG